jgi:hypothetical protein
VHTWISGRSKEESIQEGVTLISGKPQNLIIGVIQMTIGTTEGWKGHRRIIMGSELSHTEIKHFIASNGLGTDLLDERDDVLEAWRQECNLLIRGFVNYLENKFSAIEQRLDRLEQLVKERHGHQKD